MNTLTVLLKSDTLLFLDGYHVRTAIMFIWRNGFHLQEQLLAVLFYFFTASP